MVEWGMTGVERQRGAYRFAVKDKEGEDVWIVAEPAGDHQLKIFELAAGTTRQDAQALARAMNKGIAHIVLF
jgi:hypothetical protein